MLTHGESDFYVNYIDPESHVVRNYYPDFLIKTKDNKWLIVEIKGDNQIDNPVVLAKAEYARKLASDSLFNYFMIKGTDAVNLGFQQYLIPLYQTSRFARKILLCLTN